MPVLVFRLFLLLCIISAMDSRKEKPGSCPALNLINISGKMCFNDWDCPTLLKCCRKAYIDVVPRCVISYQGNHVNQDTAGEENDDSSGCDDNDRSIMTTFKPSSQTTTTTTTTTIAPDTTTIAPDTTTIAPDTTTIAPDTTTIALTTTTIILDTTTIALDTTTPPQINKTTTTMQPKEEEPCQTDASCLYMLCCDREGRFKCTTNVQYRDATNPRLVCKD